MSERIEVAVALQPRPYSVHIGASLLAEIGPRLRELTGARKVAVVTDSNVAALHLAEARDSLQASGFATTDVVIAPGEASKSWAVAGEVLETLAAAGLDRTDVVVALGGGVIGDLAGFVAATYLRGVDFAQLPTTLLAQVDSSVGGKTGVDLAAGKNLVGAFKQPLVVLADTGTLTSLPDAEWRSGLAEVAKVAVLDGEEMLGWLERDALAASARDGAVVLEAVRRCVAFKASIVAEDERESGPRECLNYGHTFGHALEKVAGYGVVPHGIAVAEGIRFASRLAVDAIGAPAAFAQRQARLLDELGIPHVCGDFDAASVHAAMASDKKARAGQVRFVLAEAPGSWRVVPVDDGLLERQVSAHLRELAGTAQKG